MMKSCVWVLCVLFTVVPANAQNNPVALQDSGLKAYRSGDYARAESLLRSALQQVQVDSAFAADLNADICALLLDEEKLREAEPACSNASELYRRLHDNHGVALVLRHIGTILLLQNRDDEGISTLKQALKTARKDPKPDPFLMSAILNSLGMAYFRTGKLGKAEKTFEDALMAANAGPDSGERPEILSNLGATADGQKKFARAEELLKEAARLTAIQLGPIHPKLTFTLAAMGRLYSDTGRFAEAQAMYSRCLEILERNDEAFAVRIALTLRALGEAYLKDGKRDQAATALRRASDTARQHLEHVSMPEILEAHAQFLLSTGKLDEARSLKAEARRARIAIESTVRAFSSFH
jgi:tetratricopeptide (TPR) repeat protein